jgi:hypothetical protein
MPVLRQAFPACGMKRSSSSTWFPAASDTRQMVFRNVSSDRNRAERLFEFVRQYREAQLDVQLIAILVQRARHDGMSFRFSFAGRDRLTKPAPVRRPQMFWNDQIEASSHCLCHRVSKDLDSAPVPDPNSTFMVCNDDCVRRLRNDATDQVELQACV